MRICFFLSISIAIFPPNKQKINIYNNNAFNYLSPCLYTPLVGSVSRSAFPLLLSNYPTSLTCIHLVIFLLFQAFSLILHDEIEQNDCLYHRYYDWSFIDKVLVPWRFALFLMSIFPQLLPIYAPLAIICLVIEIVKYIRTNNEIINKASGWIKSQCIFCVFCHVFMQIISILLICGECHYSSAVFGQTLFSILNKCKFWSFLRLLNYIKSKIYLNDVRLLYILCFMELVNIVNVYIVFNESNAPRRANDATIAQKASIAKKFACDTEDVTAKARELLEKANELKEQRKNQTEEGRRETDKRIEQLHAEAEIEITLNAQKEEYHQCLEKVITYVRKNSPLIKTKTLVLNPDINKLMEYFATVLHLNANMMPKMYYIANMLKLALDSDDANDLLAFKVKWNDSLTTLKEAILCEKKDWIIPEPVAKKLGFEINQQISKSKFNTIDEFKSALLEKIKELKPHYKVFTSRLLKLSEQEMKSINMLSKMKSLLNETSQLKLGEMINNLCKKPINIHFYGNIDKFDFYNIFDILFDYTSREESDILDKTFDIKVRDIAKLRCSWDGEFKEEEFEQLKNVLQYDPKELNSNQYPNWTEGITEFVLAYIPDQSPLFDTFVKGLSFMFRINITNALKRRYNIGHANIKFMQEMSNNQKLFIENAYKIDPDEELSNVFMPIIYSGLIDLTKLKYEYQLWNTQYSILESRKEKDLFKYAYIICKALKYATLLTTGYDSPPVSGGYFAENPTLESITSLQRKFEKLESQYKQ